MVVGTIIDIATNSAVGAVIGATTTAITAMVTGAAVGAGAFGHFAARRTAGAAYTAALLFLPHNIKHRGNKPRSEQCKQNIINRAH